ncbi:MAG: tRNA (adenosine(37)-N6)-threonylcarbamoyltransferase complex transferase subunit TsaD [Parcubacteria group bacterium]|jgi:N6-L-threonylcarbamoyladenine synthase
MKVLGIETSCDETASSIVECKNGEINILSNIVSSQVKLHAKWGGVVPNLAAREHLKNIIPVLKMALKEAGILPTDLDLIAVTNGPGLIPALLIGTNVAKTLSYVWEKPLIGIHHIEGHIYANMIREISSKKEIDFPVLCLVVSGGHTQLVLMNNHLQYEIIGQTLDDAAGEAFDKVARILNIGYPGGPAIAKKAAIAESRIMNYDLSKKNKNNSMIHDSKFMIHLPRPMLNRNTFDFSFSGLKTAVLYETKKHPELIGNKNYITEMCREFQQASIDVLVSKTIKAAKEYNPKTILLAGGVAANQELRRQLGEAIENNLPVAIYRLPTIEYTGDNAAMIATAACFRWNKMTAAQKEKALQNWKNLDTDANLKLK